jgi:hypothetical protein
MAKCDSKFCVYGWYTGGLVPDLLCNWFEPNPNWRSISANYFVSRRVMIEQLIKEGKLKADFTEQSLSIDAIGEYMFKPINVFILGSDDETTEEKIKEKWPFLSQGVGKPIYKIRYDEDLDAITHDLTNQITSVPNIGMVPNLVLNWKELPDGYLNTVLKVIKDFESVQSVNIATRLMHSEQIQENEFLNLAWLNNSIWAYDLIDKFKDKTILCIAGGPSLSENLDLIREHQDKFIIIAVSTVAEKLFQNGITPHIIATIDMKPYNQVYLDRLTPEQQKQTALLFEIDAYHGTIDSWKGKRILLAADVNRNPGTQILTEYLNINFDLPKSGTVSNMIYNFARLLGAKQILIAGYDFCYTKPQTHIDGVVSGQSIKIVQSGNQRFLQMGDSNCVEEALEVETYTGDYTYTSKAFYTYLVELEFRVKDANIPTYELSPNTAKKKGVEQRPLTDFIGDPVGEVIFNEQEKKLTNHTVKTILKNPIKGKNKKDIRYNHVTKIVYMLKQYTTFPALISDKIVEKLNLLVDKNTNNVLECLVEKALTKWRKNETDSRNR